MELLPVFRLPFQWAFLIFIMFSFIGWCSEVVYVGFIHEHRFINRGFLHGPLCPVYGFGGVVILTLPPSLYKTWIPLFLASMLLCTIVEYFVSWFMEKLFHTRWWDYSKYKFNLKGRVCLLNSVLFGFMGLGVIRFVYPHMLRFLNWLGDFVINISADVIGFILLVDIFFTVRKLVDFNTTMEKLRSFGESLRDHYSQEAWFRGDSLAEMFASVKEHGQENKDKINERILEKINRLESFKHQAAESFINRFPSMQSLQYREELTHLKLSILKKKLENKLKKKLNSNDN